MKQKMKVKEEVLAFFDYDITAYNQWMSEFIPALDGDRPIELLRASYETV